MSALTDAIAAYAKQKTIDPNAALAVFNAIANAVTGGGTLPGTGTVLSFASDTVYGTTTTPETGNITGNITGAALGVVAMVIHNNGSAPTFDGKFKKLSGSGSYVTGQLNYIFCEYIDDTHILYSISQAS